MSDIANTLFDDRGYFFNDWELQKGDVIASLELLNIAFNAMNEVVQWSGDILIEHPFRNWKEFIEFATDFSLTQLSSPIVAKEMLIQSVISIEVFLIHNIIVFSIFKLTI